MTASVLAVGLKEFVRFAEELPEIATEAAYLAINDTSRDSVPLLKREMRKQVNFPSKYLNADRLAIRRKASRVSLEAVISGRDRPTSLARFATPGSNPKNTRGRPLKVKVKGSGAAQTLRRAFLIELKNGNVGLGIRLPKDQVPDSAYKPVPLTRRGGQETGVWLLYGPSVDQVLKGVTGDVTDDIAEMLDRNFLRQFNRLTRRG
jgi:hypothetical protein